MSKNKTPKKVIYIDADIKEAVAHFCDIHGETIKHFTGQALVEKLARHGFVRHWDNESHKWEYYLGEIPKDES